MVDPELLKEKKNYQQIEHSGKLCWKEPSAEAAFMVKSGRSSVGPFPGVKLDGSKESPYDC